jgi:hypothetical protein
MPFIQLQLRRGLASEWTTANPILASGEIGVELDTTKIKIGNGTSSWNNLPYGLEQVSLQDATTAGNTTDKSISITNSAISINSLTGALTVAGGVGVGGNLNVDGTVVVGNTFLPVGNGVVDIGSPTARFGTVYIAGNTIDIGGTELTANVGNLFVDGKQVLTVEPNTLSIQANSTTVITSSNLLAVGNTVVTLDEFDKNTFTTAKYIVQAVNGTDYHSMEAFLVNDKLNAYLTVYASLKNNIKLIALDADIDSGNVRLRATGFASNNTVKIFSTKI